MQGAERHQEKFKQYFCEHRKYNFQPKFCQPCACEVDTALKNMDLAGISGGDADRFLCDKRGLSENLTRIYHPTNDTYSTQQQRRPKVAASPLPSNDNNPLGERMAAPRGRTSAALDVRSGLYDGLRSSFETDSIFGAGCNGSECSIRSQKSVKTVVSRKSSHDLKKNVMSQCKVHEEVGKTLKHMTNLHDVDAKLDEMNCRVGQQYTMGFPQDQCKRCNGTLRPSASKDVMTEIGKCDFMEWHNSDTLKITVDDMVNSKFINPMIRKLHRMSLSLMEDLESLPHQVNAVYNATIFNKQNDRNDST